MRIEELLTKFPDSKKSGANSWQACCPAHPDSNPSLSITSGTDGKILLHCHGGCTPEAICTSLGLKLSDLFPDREIRPKISAEYDYQDANGKLIFQVVRFDPKTFRQRTPDGHGGWIWKMDGVTRSLYRLPEVFSAIKVAKTIYICEGEKDCLKMNEMGLCATCNPGGAGKWQDNYTETLRGANVVIIPDKDPPGRAHAQMVAAKLVAEVESLKVIELPDLNGKPVKDAYDFFAAGGNALHIEAMVAQTPEWSTPPPEFEFHGTPDDEAETVKVKLSIRTPDEILAMSFDDTDIVLGDRLLAKGQNATICGASSVGKSRLALQMACCCITGRQFLGFETRAPTLRWLFIQAENSTRRLQFDLSKIRAWLGDDDWKKVNNQLKLHTLETDNDGFLNLDDEAHRCSIFDLIAEDKPDACVWDSLYNFQIGDLNKDVDMASSLQCISQLTKSGNSNRIPLVLHHALTGKAGAAKATGEDRASFSRNSKVLHAWTRGQINVAAGSTENSETLVISCGKNSNGKEFEPFSVVLNTETMIYEIDASFDIDGWREGMGGKAITPATTVERVAELCRSSMSKAELAKLVMDDSGCSRTAAFNWLKRAEKAELLFWSQPSEKYQKLMPKGSFNSP
jgi:hypothetical protein